MSVTKKHIKVINYTTNAFTENIVNTNFLDNRIFNIKTKPTVSGKGVEICTGFTLLPATTKKLDKISEARVFRLWTSDSTGRSTQTDLRKMGTKERSPMDAPGRCPRRGDRGAETWVAPPAGCVCGDGARSPGGAGQQRQLAELAGGQGAGRTGSPDKAPGSRGFAGGMARRRGRPALRCPARLKVSSPERVTTNAISMLKTCG